MAEDILTRDFAAKRARQMADVAYRIAISLDKKAKTYKGSCEIKFSLKGTDNLKIDFIGSVKSVKVNGWKADFDKEKFAIVISADLLKQGQNLVAIEYENEYDCTGTGMHHFVDPEDGKEYLYTQCEPYDAHRVFPCFDQPDIKATYELSVDAPCEWTVASNNPEEKTEIKGDKKTVVFKKTPKFSTYLFHISAGEYHIVEDKFGKVPLRLFCRQATKSYLREKYAFLITKQGLEFYQKFFSYPYPFEKYDQIFVPEFNHGAMENVGAVTFSEHLLYRHEPTRTEKARTADVILHEMVHMWFGDLVTMKWWGDLWLNESFADFLSYLALARATEFKEGWQSFYARKAWAYMEDQWSTTHPIVADTPNTDIAFTNFDSISYSKGAATLKQLMFLIGEDAFRKGLASYFKNYQWQNTELKDFLGCMEISSRKKLDEWAKEWLETTGVNSIEPVIEAKGGKIKSFKIKQYPSIKNSLLREHKTQVAFFSNGKKQKEIPVSYNGDLTSIKEATGSQKPDFICLNYNDFDYVKDFFDKESLGYLLENVDKVQEDLTRQMIYGSVWQMVRDSLFDPRKYTDLIISKAPAEKNLFVLEPLFRRAASILAFYLNETDYKKYSEKLHALGWEVLQKDISRELKDSWFSLIISSAGGCKSLDKLAEMLSGKFKIKGFALNQEQRWNSICRLAVADCKGVENLIAEELKKDPSDMGRKEAFAAQVAMAKGKAEHWQLFIEGKSHSLDYLRSGMAAFFSRRQKEQTRKFIDLFFENILQIFKSKNRKYAEDFFDSLFPRVFVEKTVLEKCHKLLKENQSMPTILKEILLEAMDELERSLRILGKFGDETLKGVIIRESLEKKDILKKVKITATKVEKATKKHMTPWVKQWTLQTVEIPKEEADSIAAELSKSLDSKHAWYADFKNQTTHYIIFRNKVFKVDMSKKEQYNAVTKYGLSLKIPAYQLDFSPHIKEWER